MTGVPLHRFLAPRYWWIWSILGLLWLLAWLPYRVQLGLGRGIGWLAMACMPGRRHNASCNVALCLSEFDDSAREQLVRRHFESLGIALFETSLAWWAPRSRLRRLAHVDGMAHLDAALARGRGALLLPAHFTTMELGAALLHLFVVPEIVYQKFSNPLVEEVMRRRRGRGGALLIENTRPLMAVRGLRSNRLVWYPPDQTYPPKKRVLAPFFGIPAMTNTTPMRLAALTGAAVIPFFVSRLDDGSGYRLTIGPALEDFPGADPVEDATRLNRLIEQQVRKTPAQYLWIHRRFRAYTPDYPDYYSC